MHAPLASATKNVFTRERSTYALVRTLTLSVRMQAIQPIYCVISFRDWAAVTHEARRACQEPSTEYSIAHNYMQRTRVYPRREFIDLESSRKGKLVTLQTKEDRMTVLRAAKALRGSEIFLMEDFSILERERRRRLVAEMNIARKVGEKAYIRYSDGELIIMES